MSTPAKGERGAALEAAAEWVLDRIAPVEFDVHVWTDGPTPGRLDPADRKRLALRIIDLSWHQSIAMQEQAETTHVGSEGAT